MRHTVYWHDTAAADPRPALSGDRHYDVCIVGAGYTGLWAAHFLREADPSLAIAIAEADHAGAGASGHNDGFVLQALGGRQADSLIRSFGRERTISAYAALRRSAVDLCRFCLDRGLSVDFEATGVYSVATSRGQLRYLQRSARVARGLGASYDGLSQGRQMRSRIGSPVLLAGYRHAGGLVNPYKLARGLAQAMSAQGISIYENTAVTDITEDRHGVQLMTPGGCITAEKAILATDAYRPLHPSIAGQLRRSCRYMLVTEVLSESHREKLRWPAREGFVDGGRPSVFGRLTWDNRVFLGGGSAESLHADLQSGGGVGPGPRVERRMIGMFKRYFPMLDGIEFEYLYGGIIGVTRDELPHVGQLSPRLAYAYGYSGNGIVASHAAAKALRDLVLDRQTDDRALLFVQGREPAFRPGSDRVLHRSGRVRLRPVLRHMPMPGES